MRREDYSYRHPHYFNMDKLSELIDVQASRDESTSTLLTLSLDVLYPNPPNSYHVLCIHNIVFSLLYVIPKTGGKNYEHCTVVVSCVCVCVCVCVCTSVCLSAHAILAVRATKSITKDTIVLSVRFAAILKWRFS